VPDAGFRFVPVEAAPLTRHLSADLVHLPAVALRSIRASGQHVADADVVVGMGGYVSVPPVVAARRHRRPVVLHEQNAVPGLATRVLSRGARAVALSFADAASRLPARVRTTVTGNPVRAQVRAVRDRRDALRDEALTALDLERGRTTVLVFGGSLGALHLNRTAAEALTHLRARSDLQVLILTGPRHLGVVGEAAAREMPLRVRALPFLDRMELAYAVADAAVARAGATSIAELAICGLASILVPYPHATANHQDANARELERAGAAEVVADSDLRAEDLAIRIARLVDDVPRRTAMAERAAAWARPEAAADLAAVVTRNVR
jgi:UDP-N-acetylglucosamine--N-acetylmuramyl-(pentapeptide) pyrophosphoryl-undecaprenol N-acetylglucosamine transferase